MASIEQTLFTYLAHRHIDLMPPDVVDRFDKYRETGSFIGHMRSWNTSYYGQTLQMLNTTMPPYNRNDPNDQWKKLYMSCQRTFQKMYENKKPSVGVGNTYIPAINTFIDKWFGPNENKTFTYANATKDADKIFKDLARFLKNNPQLESRLTNNLSSVFSDITFSKFCDKLKDGKYNKDPDFQKKLQAVIQYIKDYAPTPGYPEHPDPRLWPTDCGYNLATAPGAGTPVVTITEPVLQSILYDNITTPLPPTVKRLDPDPDNWYEIKDIDKHIRYFQTDYVSIFDELLTNKTLREKFIDMADDPVKKALETAITYTDYENTESDDYVPPEVTDSKNWMQKIKKWSNDTYENHLRRFTNPTRGTRIFFSPHSQNIMKGFDKAEIKPTDGLEGILAKKDDAKLRNAVNADPTSKKHFDWFVKKLEELKKETPDDFEGALRDGIHLQRLVINLIIKANKEGRGDKGVKDKALTALEVLSVAKYGLLCSRTFNKLNEATKDLKILSDEKLSWNKNEGVKTVATIMDKTAGLAIRGIGLAATGIRNFISHRKTKIGKDISKFKNLDAAYKEWQEEDIKRHNDLINSNAAHNVTQTLTDLNNPARVPVTGTPFKTNIQINAANIGDETTPGTIKGELQAARTAGATTVTIAGNTVNIDDLQNDVFLFDDATAHGIAPTLATLNNPARVPVIGTTFKTNIQINENNLGDDSTPGTIKGEIKAARDAGATTVTINGVTANIDDLQHDVDLFEDAFDHQKQETNWRENNPDIIHDLIAHWDMMETFYKTHAFSLGSMKVKRDKMLENWNDKKSIAQQLTKQNMTDYWRT